MPIVINEENKKPIKAWVEGVSFEEAAKEQLRNIASLPFIYRWLAVMPDVHMGKGATVGSVIATDKAIMPAAVGCDIGCGMSAVKLDVKANQLPDNLKPLREAIEKAVPHGRTNHGGRGDRGAWGNVPPRVEEYWKTLSDIYETVILDKHPKIGKGNDQNHLGTLGGGNHFVELCLDEEDSVWIMLHSGSRGVGNRIGRYFIERAKKEMEKFFIHLPDKDLAFLPQDTELFEDYMTALMWAQKFAYSNRRVMMENILDALTKTQLLPENFGVLEAVVDCHHNYVARENHFKRNVWVTRKGAVRARKGDLGIIPGSMGAKSFIVRGKGNPDSFHSCSHGAGRTMSRTQAKRIFSVEDHEKATAGVECRKDADILDETPMAYKSIDSVMKAQEDLVDIVHTLKQVVCVKG